MVLGSGLHPDFLSLAFRESETDMKAAVKKEKGAGHHRAGERRFQEEGTTRGSEVGRNLPKCARGRLGHGPREGGETQELEGQQWASHGEGLPQLYGLQRPP